MLAIKSGAMLQPALLFNEFQCVTLTSNYPIGYISTLELYDSADRLIDFVAVVTIEVSTK